MVSGASVSTGATFAKLSVVSTVDRSGIDSETAILRHRPVRFPKFYVSKCHLVSDAIIAASDFSVCV